MYSKDKDIIKHAVSTGVYFNENNNLVGIKGKILKGGQSDKYPSYYIKYEGKTRKVSIHRLKAYLLYGDQIFDPTLEVRHLNGNKLDYSDKNMAIGTASANYFDVPQKIRDDRAEAGASKVRKFSKEQIEAIRNGHLGGLSLKKLAEMYHSCKSTMSYIINSRTYK